MRKKFSVKKGDLVHVITGRAKGKSGEVMNVDRLNGRVKVKGVNLLTTHKRPSAQDKGGIVKREGYIHISNVMLNDPKDNKPTRVGVMVDDKGVKARVSKRSNEIIS